jgi:ElaB/YqjD/DUF883 family membrane-anchored ribosome-binding protein
MASKEKELVKIFSKVYSLSDKIDDKTKEISMMSDELKDLSDQLELILNDEELVWKNLAPGLKQKVKRKIKGIQKENEYGKWKGNL